MERMLLYVRYVYECLAEDSHDKDNITCFVFHFGMSIIIFSFIWVWIHSSLSHGLTLSFGSPFYKVYFFLCLVWIN